MEALQGLLGYEKQVAYKYLKRDVLKPFMEEVVDKGFVVYIELDDTSHDCRPGKKVIYVKFKIVFNIED